MTAEWVRVDLDAVETYGADAAVLLGLIAYRCNLTGSWVATLDKMVEESRLTLHRVRTALGVLRSAGAVEGSRADSLVPVLTWTIPAGQAVNQDSLITRIGNPSSPVRDSLITSYTESQELPLVVPTADDQPATKPKRTARRACQLPEDFRPQQAHFTLATSLGVDLRTEGPKFVDYHRAKGSTMKDWDAALRTWIRNAATFAQRSGMSYAATAGDPPGRIPPARTDPFASGRG